MNGCYWPRSPACCHSGCLPATKVCAPPAHILKTRPQTHHTTPPPPPLPPTYLPTFEQVGKGPAQMKKTPKISTLPKNGPFSSGSLFREKKPFFWALPKLGEQIQLTSFGVKTWRHQQGDQNDLLWCKNVKSPTERSNWPPMVQTRYVYNRGIQLTFQMFRFAKNSNFIAIQDKKHFWQHQYWLGIDIWYSSLIKRTKLVSS